MLTVVVLAAALTQLWGTGHWRAIFQALEVEPFGRFGAAALELAGLGLFWWPGRRAYGAALICAVCLAAAAAHLVALGISSAPPAMALAALSGLVLRQTQGDFRR
jgi:hypothetical protein